MFKKKAPIPTKNPFEGLIIAAGTGLFVVSVGAVNNIIRGHYTYKTGKYVADAYMTCNYPQQPQVQQPPMQNTQQPAQSQLPVQQPQVPQQPAQQAAPAKS